MSKSKPTDYQAFISESEKSHIIVVCVEKDGNDHDSCFGVGKVITRVKGGNVFRKASQVAGDGLFSKKKFRKDDIIMDVPRTIVLTAEAAAVHQMAGNGDAYGAPYFIDINEIYQLQIAEGSLANFVNDACNDSANAAFMRMKRLNSNDQPEYRIILYALKGVNRREEIFVDFGMHAIGQDAAGNPESGLPCNCSAGALCRGCVDYFIAPWSNSSVILFS